jgi:hypothetical protein
MLARDEKGRVPAKSNSIPIPVEAKGVGLSERESARHRCETIARFVYERSLGFIRVCSASGCKRKKINPTCLASGAASVLRPALHSPTM